MEETNEEFNPTQMLAAAIGMAGLLGGVAVAARRRRRPDERATIGFDTPVASLRLSVVKPDTEKLQRRARASTKDARDALERVQLPALPAALAAPDLHVDLDDLRAQAGEATDRVLSVATRFGGDALDRANVVAHRLTDDVVSPATHRLTSEVLPRLRDDLLPQMTEALRDDLLPQVTTAAGVAAASMAGAAQTSRKQLAEAAKRAREEGTALGADVASIAGASAKKASKKGMFGRKSKKKNPADDLLATLGTAGALGIAASKAGKAGKATEQAVGQARKQSQKAASATTSFVGDTIGAIFWLLTAVAVLLYAFASPEQREKVISNARTFWEQASELYQDFKGYSEEI